MIKRLQLKSLLSDRGFQVAIGVMALVLILIVILAAFNIQPGELRVPIKYSRFDPRNYSLGQWYYLLNYVLFGLTVFAGHLLLGAKLYQAKGRFYALVYVYLGAIVLLITAIFFMSIIKVVSLSQ